MVLEKVDHPTNQGSPTAPCAETSTFLILLSFFNFPGVCVLYICFSDSTIASHIHSLSLSLSLSISHFCVFEKEKNIWVALRHKGQ